jgi:integrase
MVDGSLDQSPTEAQAPHGWVVFPPLKGQDPVLHFLTAFERRELTVAFDGYLAALEALWLRERVDYPLFPAVRKESLTDGRPVQVEQSRAYQPVTRNGPALWLQEAERAARVQHIEARAYHGFRRRAADYLLETTDLKALTVAGGWSSQRTPEQIYVEKRRHPDRARAREAMDDKRKTPPEDDPESVGDV